MSEELIKQENEISNIAKNIQTGLQAFEQRKADLTAKAESFQGLVINGYKDKEGYKAVSAARKALKVERVQVEKEGKSMRDPLTQISKTISSKEKELIAIIEPTENDLAVKEKAFEDEVEQIRLEEEAKENKRIQDMADQLAAYQFPFNIEQLRSITDEQFQEALDYAKKAFQVKEEARIAEEKAEVERKAAEQEQLRKDREELENLRKQQAEAQRIIDEENAKLAAERKAFEDEQAKKAQEEKHKLEIEAAKQKAIEDQKKAELEKEKEAKRKAERAPDKEKLNALVLKLEGLIDFKVKSVEAKEILSETSFAIGVLVETLKSQIESL